MSVVAPLGMAKNRGLRWQDTTDEVEVRNFGLFGVGGLVGIGIGRSCCGDFREGGVHRIPNGGC